MFPTHNRSHDEENIISVIHTTCRRHNPVPDRRGEVSARLRCFSADSNDAVAFTSVSMMETEEVKLASSAKHSHR